MGAARSKSPDGNAIAVITPVWLCLATRTIASARQVQVHQGHPRLAFLSALPRYEPVRSGRSRRELQALARDRPMTKDVLGEAGTTELWWQALLCSRRLGRGPMDGRRSPAHRRTRCGRSNSFTPMRSALAHGRLCTWGAGHPWAKEEGKEGKNETALTSAAPEHFQGFLVLCDHRLHFRRKPRKHMPFRPDSIESKPTGRNW